MITIGHFIPDHARDGNFEVNHFGVAVRCRNGKLSLVADVAVETDSDEPGKKHATGRLVVDASRSGTWIVPSKHEAAFKRQWDADRAEQAARAKKEG